MKLALSRKWKTEESTIGELALDGAFFCFTLEDPEREKKIPGETAIPLGEYRISLTYSNRFKKIMPLLTGDAAFQAVWKGVRIHSGNTAKDTEGCVLVGSLRLKDRIQGGSVLYPKLLEQIQVAIAKGEEVSLLITGASRPDGENKWDLT